MNLSDASYISFGALLGAAGLIIPFVKWLNAIENQNAINAERINGIQQGLNNLREDVKDIHKRLHDGK